MYADINYNKITRYFYLPMITVYGSSVELNSNPPELRYT